MMQQLRSNTERANVSAMRVDDAALAHLGFATFGTTTAWNVKPSVHTSAICTHGKRYHRRLQEMLT